MFTPSFWYKSNSLVSYLFYPLSVVWRVGAYLRAKKTNKKLFRTPIICIGNVVIGGAGKTPSALAIAKILSIMNLKVHILGKGYKGTKKGPIRVNHYIHTPMMVGDEALVLSKYFPCWISGKRLVALQKIIAEKADTIILDDGLQDTSIYKDFSILVIILYKPCRYNNRNENIINTEADIEVHD